MLLGDDLSVDLVLLALFLFEFLIAPGLEIGKAAREVSRAAAIEPNRAARQILQEAPIMADDDERRGKSLEFGLEPFDGGKIEMVGRLVEQQNIGLGRHDPRERRAARFAARKSRRVFIPAEAEFVEDPPRPMRIVGWSESRLDIGEGGRKSGKIRLLRQIADAGVGLHEARSAIAFDEAGRDL